MSGKLLIYDFRCQSCDHKYDAMARIEDKTHVCPRCGGQSMRLVSTPRIDPRLGLDPESFPTAGDKWARKHEQGRKLDEAREREHGPSEWGADGADIRR